MFFLIKHCLAVQLLRIIITFYYYQIVRNKIEHVFLVNEVSFIEFVVVYFSAMFLATIKTRSMQCTTNNPQVPYFLPTVCVVFPFITAESSKLCYYYLKNRYIRSLAPADFSGAVFTHAHFQKVAQISSICEGIPSLVLRIQFMRIFARPKKPHEPRTWCKQKFGNSVVMSYDRTTMRQK